MAGLGPAVNKRPSVVIVLNEQDAAHVLKDVFLNCQEDLGQNYVIHHLSFSNLILR